MYTSFKRLSLKVSLLTLIVIATLHVFSGYVVHSVEHNLSKGELSINKDTVSAELYAFPLIKILQQIEDQCKLSYTADESVLEEKISVQFKDLLLEAALKRIFKSLNYSLFYDATGNLSGFVILGRAEFRPDITVRNNRSMSSASKNLYPIKISGTGDSMETHKIIQRTLFPPIVPERIVAAKERGYFIVKNPADSMIRKIIKIKNYSKTSHDHLTPGISSSLALCRDKP